MTPEQLERFRALLLEQRAAVSADIEAHSGRDTLATSEVEAAIVASNDNLLQKIEFALNRIEDGSYGDCAQCGGQIAVPRLEAKPAVSLCTGCQEKKELEQNNR